MFKECGLTSQLVAIGLAGKSTSANLRGFAEGSVEIEGDDGEFEGDSELHSKSPYLCEGCGERFSEGKLLAA